MSASGESESQTPSERSFAVPPSTNSLGLLNTLSPNIGVGGGQSSATINPTPTRAIYPSSETINTAEQNIDTSAPSKRRPSIARFAPTPPIDETPPIECQSLPLYFFHILLDTARQLAALDLAHHRYSNRS